MSVRFSRVARALPLLLLLVAAPSFASTTIPSAMSEESLDCIQCHADESTGIYQQWGTSKHYRANVGCYECHKAEAGDPDRMEHNGYDVAIIVSPKDCPQCHENEVAEFAESHHA